MLVGRWFAVMAVAGFAGAAAGQVVTFDDLPLAPQSFQNGATLSPPGQFVSGGATFNNDYNATFGSWSGWSYSNVVNVTTPGFGNQYAAYHLPGGGGDASANYGVAFAFSSGDATVTLPDGLLPASMRVTNATYAALSMRDGDAFAKKFGGVGGDDPDFFRLTIQGRDANNQPTGSVEFFLADYRFSNNSQDYIVSQWTTVDLSPLGPTTQRLSFGLDSTDVGMFGMNTPAYFAVDNIALTAVPEPSALVLVGAAVAARLRRRKLVGEFRCRRSAITLASSRRSRSTGRD